MKVELLLGELGRVTDSPNATLALRTFVLDLAVRGSLTAPADGDEPASALLSQIDQRRFENDGSRSRTRSKQYPPVAADEQPYPVPETWLWMRLRQVTADRGQTVPDRNFTYIDVTAINKEAGRIGDTVVLGASEAPSRARKVVARGDVLYSCVRPNLLNVAIVDRDLNPPPIASTAFAVLDGLGCMLPEYLWIVLRSPYFVRCVEEKMRGQAYPAINDRDLALIPVPVPPRAEQRRIVDRVEELMTLLDQLEQSRDATDGYRSKARVALAHALIDFGDLDRTWILSCMPRVFTRAEDVVELRTLLMDLAVVGRLGHQGPNGSSPHQERPEVHEPDETTIFPTETSEDTAEWVSVPLGELASLVTSGSRGWAEFYSADGPTFLRAQNIRFGRLNLDHIAHVSLPERMEGRRTSVDVGDIVVVITGAGVTNPAIVDIDLGEAYVSQHVGLIKLMRPEMARWVLLCLMARAGARDELVSRAYGAGKPGLNLDNLRTLVLPVPPIAEQQRILAKLDELLSVCDQLERELASAESHRAAALDALLRDAIINFKEPSTAS